MMTNKVRLPLLPRSYQDKHELQFVGGVEMFSKYRKTISGLEEYEKKTTFEIKPLLNNTLVC